MVRQWVARKWLFLFIVVLVICSFGSSSGRKAEADAASLSLQICRANVEPCQTEVSIPEGGAVGLDLVLSDTNSNTSPFQIAAWETHFRIGDSSVAELVPDTDSGRPVQQQGDSELALEGLHPLQSSGNEHRSQFFTAQNQFDSDSGRLDYSVTLVGFDPAKPQSRVLPFSSQARLHLGRVTVSGLTGGSSGISPEDPTGNPSQVVALDTGEGFGYVTVPLPVSQATVKTGNVTTAKLQGQIAQPDPDSDLLTTPFPAVLSITFWRPGAIPQWRDGNDLPLVTFSQVSTDAAGTFRVTDIAPSLLPPGVYDVRVASRVALPKLVQNVAIPHGGNPGDSPPITSISTIELRDGDIDGDNTIDQADLDALKASFARLESESGFNSNADFNGDGVVDVLDFARLAQNFGVLGD